jgi:primosomal protein N'
VLDYRAPEGGCWLGAFVEVPLGPRKVLGVVWGPGKGDYDLAKIRAVNRVLDAAPMREEMREFLTKAGAYTLTPMSQMLRLATRVPGLSDPPSMRKVYRLGQGEPDRMTMRAQEGHRDAGGVWRAGLHPVGAVRAGRGVHERHQGAGRAGRGGGGRHAARHALPAARPRPAGQGR